MTPMQERMVMLCERGMGVAFAILDELLDMRERLNGLINRLNHDMGQGLDRGSQAHIPSPLKTKEGGLALGGSNPSWAQRGVTRGARPIVNIVP